MAGLSPYQQTILEALQPLGRRELMNKPTAVLVEAWMRVERPTLDNFTRYELQVLAVQSMEDIDLFHRTGALEPWCEALGIPAPSWAQERDIGLT